MLRKCLLLLLVVVGAVVADRRSLRTAEPGNWTVQNCIVVKMSAQVPTIPTYLPTGRYPYLPTHR